MPSLVDRALQPDLKDLTCGVVLHKHSQPFYQQLATGLENAFAQVTFARPKLEIEFSTSQSPSATAKRMHEMAEKVDVVAATAVNHPVVTDAVADLARKGVPVFALLSEFAQEWRKSYIGLDNFKTGRGAGWLLCNAARKPGKLAVFIGGHRWHGHDLRASANRLSGG